MKRGHRSARHRAFVVAMLAWVLLVLSPLAATAQDGEEEQDQPEAGLDSESAAPPPPSSAFVALPGTCESDAAPFSVGLGTECVFDALEGGDLEAIETASLWDGVRDVPCSVEGRRLRCVEVGALISQPGAWPLELRLNDEIVPEAALFVSAVAAEDEFRIALDPELPVLFEGRPLSVFSRGPDELTEAYLTMRVQGASRIVDTIAFAPGTFDEGRLNRLTLDVPPGDYRVWPCVGASPLSCEELPGGYRVQVLDPTLVELIPGHNRRSGQRINIVFTGSGLSGVEQLSDIATLTLGMGGPIAVDQEGQPTDDPERTRNLHFGPMAIEPLRSNAGKFNFWILPDDLNAELALIAEVSRLDIDAFGLPNAHVTTFYDGSESGGVSDARASSYFGRELVPPLPEIRFGGARVSVDLDAPVLSSETLAHEWGHGIFELRDEYFGFDGRPILTAFPNCAPDLETATEWWTPVLGEVDPFVDEVIEARVAAGLVQDAEAARDDLANDVLVQPIVGGCYGNVGQGGAVRPSIDSLMNTEIPVFGMVNRQRVEAVLGQFDVGGPLIDVGDVEEVGCRARSERLFCDGSLAPEIDPPEALAIYAEGAPCRFDASASPVTFSCFALDPGGEDVVLSFEEQTLDVGIERPPEPVEPPSTTTSTTASPIETSPTSSTIDESPQNPVDERAAAASGESGGGEANWRIPIAVGLAVAGLSVASVLLKRRSDEKSAS